MVERSDQADQEVGMGEVGFTRTLRQQVRGKASRDKWEGRKRCQDQVDEGLFNLVGDTADQDIFEEIPETERHTGRRSNASKGAGVSSGGSGSSSGGSSGARQSSSRLTGEHSPGSSSAVPRRSTARYTAEQCEPANYKRLTKGRVTDRKTSELRPSFCRDNLAAEKVEAAIMENEAFGSGRPLCASKPTLLKAEVPVMSSEDVRYVFPSAPSPPAKPANAASFKRKDNRGRSTKDIIGETNLGQEMSGSSSLASDSVFQTAFSTEASSGASSSKDERDRTWRSGRPPASSTEAESSQCSADCTFESFPDSVEARAPTFESIPEAGMIPDSALPELCEYSVGDMRQPSWSDRVTVSPVAAPLMEMGRVSLSESIRTDGYTSVTYDSEAALLPTAYEAEEACLSEVDPASLVPRVPSNPISGRPVHMRRFNPKG